MSYAPPAPPTQPPGSVPSPDGKKKKRMNTPADGTGRKTRLYAVGAAVLAVLAFLAVLVGGAPPVEVFAVQAVGDINPQTALDPSMFTAVSVGEDLTANSNAYTGATAEEAIASLELGLGVPIYARTPITSGALVFPSMLSAEAQLRVEVAPDERLVSVSASIASAAGGTLRVGDHVDVIAALQLAADNTAPDVIANVLAEDIEVVHITLQEDDVAAAGSAQSPTGFNEGDEQLPSRDDLIPGDAIPGTYTLRLPANLATAVATFAVEGKLFLVYRPQDALDGEIPAASLIESLCGRGAGSQATEGADASPFGAEGPAALPTACASVLARFDELVGSTSPIATVAPPDAGSDAAEADPDN